MLTKPDYAAPADVLEIRISSLDANLSVPLTVTPDQVAAWTDDDLLAKVRALRDAVRALLPPGADLQLAVGWTGSVAASVLRESETVPAH